MGTGYALTSIEVSTYPVAKPLFEDIVFLIASAATANALSQRFTIVSRWRVQAAIVTVAMIGAAISLSRYQSVRLETISIQMGCTLLVCVSLMSKRWAMLGRCDRLLFATFSIVCGLLVLQCFAYFFLPDTGTDTVAWRNSTSGFIFQLTGGAIGVGLTSAILLALSLDVIERLHRAAVTDALTGILNRRGFEETCLRLAKRLKGKSPMALIMVDLDHFKKINDTHGHEAGDLVITRMAGLLGGEAGIDGCAGRLGGEEFAMLLPCHDLLDAVTRANDIREAFSRICWPFDNEWFPPTASFGVTILYGDEPYASSIARADALLYLAKRSGRDCVMYGDSTSSASLSRKGEPAFVG